MKTAPFLLDALVQLHHVFDLVPVNAVLQSGNGTRNCKPALQLTGDISNMHCEHDCLALCFTAAHLLDY